MTGKEIGEIRKRVESIDGEAVGRLMRAGCAARGWSQGDLAEMSGASRSAISRWSRGAVHIQLPALVRTLVALGVCQPPPDIAPPIVPRYGMRRPLCMVEGCGRRHRCHGYCGGHMNRVRKYGDPMVDWPIGSLRGKRTYQVEEAMR